MPDRETIIETHSGPSAIGIIAGMLLVVAVVLSAFLFYEHRTDGGRTSHVDGPSVTVNVGPPAQ